MGCALSGREMEGREWDTGSKRGEGIVGWAGEDIQPGLEEGVGDGSCGVG